jgi:hypothetical protein
MNRIKRAAVQPLRRLVARSGIHFRLRHYLDRILLLRLSRMPDDYCLDLKSLHNDLPNDGPIPVTQSSASAREIVSMHSNASERRTYVEGFEGFAMDLEPTQY